MEPYFNVPKSDVICFAKRSKTGLRGEHPGETYACLIYRCDGKIRMTVNDFQPSEDGYTCCLFFSDFIADTEEEYENMTEKEPEDTAYRTWCSGAR